MLKFVALVSIVGCVTAATYSSSSYSAKPRYISSDHSPIIVGDNPGTWGPQNWSSGSSSSLSTVYGKDKETWEPRPKSVGRSSYKQYSYTTPLASAVVAPVTTAVVAPVAPVAQVAYAQPVTYVGGAYPATSSYSSYVAPQSTARYESYEYSGPITAAVQSQRTVKTYDVPSTYSSSQPLTIDVPSSSQTVNFLMRSKSSNINLETYHEPTPGTFKETASEEEPHVSRHTVTRPLVQEVREVVTPFRKITQELQPVQESVETVVPKGQQYQQQTYVAPAVSTATYAAPAVSTVAVAQPAAVAVAQPAATVAVVEPVAVAAPAVATTQYVAAAQPVAVAAQPVAVYTGLSGGYGTNYGGSSYSPSTSSYTRYTSGYSNQY